MAITGDNAARVVILATSFADAAPAIRLAEALVQLHEGTGTTPAAAMIGVLALDPVLDAALGAPLLPRGRLRPAAMPRATATATTTAATTTTTGPAHARALSRETLAAAYASDARAFSARLTRAAAARRLTCEFRTDQGLATDLAFRLRRPGDMLVLGYRRLLETGAPVVTLCRPEDAQTQALARALSRALRRRAVFLPPEAADQPGMIEGLSATAMILAPELARQPARLSALTEAARCPVLVAPDAA